MVAADKANNYKQKIKNGHDAGKGLLARLDAMKEQHTKEYEEYKKNTRSWQGIRAKGCRD